MDAIPFDEESMQVLTIGTYHPNIVMTNFAAAVIIPSADASKVLILHNAAGQYYELPGGDIQADEDYYVGIARNVREKTGCIIDLQVAGAWQASASTCL